MENENAMRQVARGTWLAASGKWQSTSSNWQNSRHFQLLQLHGKLLATRVATTLSSLSSLFSTSLCHCAANWGSCTDVLWAALPISSGTKYLICCTGRAEATTLVRFVLATFPIVRNIAHTPHIAMQLQIFFYCIGHSFVSLYCAASAA